MTDNKPDYHPVVVGECDCGCGAALLEDPISGSRFSFCRRMEENWKEDPDVA